MSGLIAAAVTTVVATVYSVQQQREAAKAQKKANEAQNRITERRNNKEKLDAIRKARIQAAQAANAGAVGGFGVDSTGSAGNVASIGSQTAANVNFLTQNSQDSKTALQFSNASLDASTNANIAQGVASLASLGIKK